MKEITIKDLESLQETYSKDKVNNALRRVLLRNDLSNLFYKQEEASNTKFVFSDELKTLPVANQKRSGRCWIFAGLNVVREAVAKKYGLESFELSQNYISFWDKFEKINYFIESIDDFLDINIDDRTLQHILNAGIQDGGQWDMFVNVVEKYGIVPKEKMIETASSDSTFYMNNIINIKLREYAANARKLKSEGKETDIPTLKVKALQELYTFLVTNFGVPPKEFNFEYTNKDGYHIIKGLTPLSFYKEAAGGNLRDYVSLINSPTKDKPFLKSYTIPYLGNVVGGNDIKHLNLPIERLKELIITQIKAGEPVWFGSDVSKFGDRNGGVWDDKSFEIEDMLGMNLTLSKEDQLDYRDSAMNHAMVITGVDIVDMKPKRYKIENSWGGDHGEKGYFVITDTRFDRYVYQAVINKKYLKPEELAAYEAKPIVLKPWDPMGSLAD
jgi:bleomycin hydrolase